MILINRGHLSYYMGTLSYIYRKRNMELNQITFKSLDNSNIIQLIKASRQGINYDSFDYLLNNFPFNNSEWSKILHVSERTIQRYKREKKRFNSMQSERLLLIMLLLQKGIEVFGNKKNFISWLGSTNISLGGIQPKSLLDSTFGINLVKDELVKIEHGILA